MIFEGTPVPANLVQIMDITNKDRTPLEPGNFRRDRIGIFTMCWISGSFNKVTPYFKFKVIVKDSVVESVDLFWLGNASSGTHYPVEVEPGIFEIETNTSIYRFRVLAGEEEKDIGDALADALMQAMAQHYGVAEEQTGAVPVS